MTQNKYRSPKQEDKIFTRYWNTHIEDITSRPNFVPGHLEILSILCDLHSQYDEISAILADEGWVFSNEGRYGTQKKIHPLVLQRNKIIDAIRSYNKSLGIAMSQVETEEPEETNEWED